MIDLGKHAVFIWSSYGVVLVVLAALVAWLINDGLRLRRRLAELEAQALAAVEGLRVERLPVAVELEALALMHLRHRAPRVASRWKVEPHGVAQMRPRREVEERLRVIGSDDAEAPARSADERLLRLASQRHPGIFADHMFPDLTPTRFSAMRWMPVSRR